MKNMRGSKKYSDYITSSNLFHNVCVGDFITHKKNQKIKMKKYKKWNIGPMKLSKFLGPNLPICSVSGNKEISLQSTGNKEKFTYAGTAKEKENYMSYVSGVTYTTKKEFKKLKRQNQSQCLNLQWEVKGQL